MDHASNDAARKQETASAAPASPGAGSGLRRWARRLWRIILYGCFLTVFVYLVLVTTPLTERLYLWLAVTQPPAQADVIVCLGGSPERMFWAAKLYHQGYAPKVAVTSWLDRADEMHDWVHMCGVPEEDLLVDRRSGTTGDHPEAVAALAGIDKTRRLLIVTNHEHSRRVRAVFEHAGYRDFIIYGGDPPFARDIDSGRRWRWRVLRLPYIAYEYAALVQYKLQGRF